jgi:hypothetical protein
MSLEGSPVRVAGGAPAGFADVNSAPDVFPLRFLGKDNM